MYEAVKIAYAVSTFKEVLTDYLYFHDMSSSESKKIKDAIHVMEDFYYSLEDQMGGDKLKLKNLTSKLYKIADELESEAEKLFINHKITTDEKQDLLELVWKLREIQMSIDKK